MSNHQPVNVPAADVFQRVWAGSLSLLIAVTWRLWFQAGDFPVVPIVWDETQSRTEAIAATLTMLLGLAWILISRKFRRWPFWVVLACLAMLFIGNQHRLQPWAYQSFLYCVVFATMAPASMRRWVTAIAISVYIYSSLGKFDYQFIHTVGQDFVSSVLGPPETASPDRWRLMLAFFLPAAELGVAIGLWLRRSRRAAGVLAMGMHGSLVLLLGPWWLDHSTGVVVWNACLIGQAWLLFVSPTTATRESTSPMIALSLIGQVVILIALVMPTAERWGYWDHWLSWSLYSPHTSRVTIEIHQSAIDTLPTGAVHNTSPPDDESNWVKIASDRWSLAELGVPVYPQARFQLGVARSLARALDDPSAIRVIIESTSNRRTGRRIEEWIQGRVAIEQACDAYGVE